MANLRDSDEFRGWLIHARGLSPRGAGDVVSRCRRIQRVLDIPLPKALESAGLERTLERLDEEADNYLSRSTQRVAAIGVLRTAARHYNEFLRGR